MEDLTLEKASNRPTWLPWAVAGAAGFALVLLLVLGLLPAQSRTAELEKHVKTLNDEVKKREAGARAEQEKAAKIEAEKAELAKQQTTTKEELESALKEKESALKEKDAAIAELQEAQRDLTETLGTQIAAGDVLIQERRGELVVDVADKLLFEKGQADVSEAGKALLTQVAKSIRRLPPKLRFQVGGHTDSQRVTSPELVERYPTNWELSTARASNVVRFLQDVGKVPGNKLIAAGFSQYRPVATNNNEAGRQKNRRIEIVIVMPKG